MKTTQSILCALFLASLPAAPAVSQLKSGSAAGQSASAALVRPGGGGSGVLGGGLGTFFGLIDPDRFMMRHSLSYSYLSAGGTGLSMADYTNSMFYSIADPLDVRFDVTLQGSPFGPTAGAGRDELSRIYLSRAELNYRPWENFSMQFQYRQLPYSFYRNPFDPLDYGYPWGDR